MSRHLLLIISSLMMSSISLSHAQAGSMFTFFSGVPTYYQAPVYYQAPTYYRSYQPVAYYPSPSFGFGIGSFWPAPARKVCHQNVVYGYNDHDAHDHRGYDHDRDDIRIRHSDYNGHEGGRHRQWGWR